MKTRTLFVSLFLFTLSFFVLPRQGHSAGWFDGVPADALQWIAENAQITGDWHNAKIATFGNLEITIHFFDGSDGFYTTEDQGYWDWGPMGYGPPVWVEVLVPVWNEGEAGYYWIRITDLELEEVKYISGQWRQFGSKDEIIKEVKSAESAEAIREREASERAALALLNLLAIRSWAFTTGIAGENKAPLISSETPIATADKTALRIVDRLVMLKSSARSQETEVAQTESQKSNMVSGIITYEDFEFHEISGDTVEVLAEVQQFIGDWIYGILVPISQVDIDFTDWSKLGVTGYLKREFFTDSVDFSFGFALAAEQTWMDYMDVDDSLGYGGGPLGSCRFNLGPVDVGIGVNYLYMANSEYDTVDIVTAALNVGIPIGNQFVLNLYGYRTENLDSDSDYWTTGASGTYMASDVFGIVAGINTVSQLDDFEATVGHIGGNWRY